MSDAPCRGSGPSAKGFTLIEVIGALVIFSMGVIMVLQLTGSLSQRMQYAAQTSTVVARAQERLDSLEATPFDSLSLGTRQDSLTVVGTRYVLSHTIAQVTGLLYRIDVTASPVAAGAGPTYSTTSYKAAAW